MIIYIIIILVLFMSVSAFIIANYKYKRTNDYKNENIYIEKYSKGVPDNLQLVNIGSTYARFAFDSYDSLRLNAFNFALRSQSVEMDYALLRQYAGHIKPKATILIPVAPCLLLYINNSPDSFYYDILEKDNIPYYRPIKKIERSVPLLFHPKKARKLIEDSIPMTSAYDIYPEYMTKEQQKSEIENLLDCWKSLFHLNSFETADFSEENLKNIAHNTEVLSEIVCYCKMNDWKPIFLITPFGRILNDRLSEEFVRGTLKEPLMRVLEAENIPILDYQRDEYFMDRPQLYLDGGFLLNERGSRIFIKRLFEDLKKYDIMLNNRTVGAYMNERDGE